MSVEPVQAIHCTPWKITWRCSYGVSRSAASMLKDQDDRSKSKDEKMLANLHYVKDIGHASRQAFSRVICGKWRGYERALGI